MARAVNPIDRTVSEGIEGEMRSYGLTAETELRGLQHEPFHEPGVYSQQVDGRDVAKGAIAGAVAGLIAGWVMVKFQEGWAKVAEGRNESKNLRKSVPEHRAKRDFDSSNRDEQEASGAQDETPDDATVHTAELISEKLFDHTLTREEKKVAGPAVHYAFSVAVGALYGAAVELSPAATAGFGTVFGAAVFVAADEIAVPAMGLSPNVQKAPLSKHIYGLVSHLVFGVATEAARRPIRRLTA